MEEKQENKLIQKPDPKKKSGLKIRALTASVIGTVYVGVVVLTILFNFRFVFDIFMILVTLVAALEVSRAFANKFAKPVWIFVVLNVILGYTAFYVVHFLIGGGSGGITAYFLVLAVMFLACIVYIMFSKTNSMNNVLTTMLVLIYPTTLCVYMLSLNYLPSVQHANSAILLLFLLPAISDTAAYMVGSLFRGPKLAPLISPKKTISGAIGGVVGGIAAGGIVLLFSEFGLFNIAPLADSTASNVIHYLVIGAAGAVFVIIGDLIASYTKRQCGVKDFGTILPGHGGIMDRLDSMILCGVFLYVYYYALSFSSVFLG